MRVLQVFLYWTALSYLYTVQSLDHPVQEIAWKWSNTTTNCVSNCEKIVDGPMAANGDFGVVIGASTDGLTVALGKNDFWGWPGTLLWHSSFDPFPPGEPRFSLTGAIPPPLPPPKALVTVVVFIISKIDPKPKKTACFRRGKHDKCLIFWTSKHIRCEPDRWCHITIWLWSKNL